MVYFSWVFLFLKRGKSRAIRFRLRIPILLPFRSISRFDTYKSCSCGKCEGRNSQDCGAEKACTVIRLGKLLRNRCEPRAWILRLTRRWPKMRRFVSMPETTLKLFAFIIRTTNGRPRVVPTD